MKINYYADTDSLYIDFGSVFPPQRVRFGTLRQQTKHPTKTPPNAGFLYLNAVRVQFLFLAA